MGRVTFDIELKIGSKVSTFVIVDEEELRNSEDSLSSIIVNATRFSLNESGTSTDYKLINEYSNDPKIGSKFEISTTLNHFFLQSISNFIYLLEGKSETLKIQSIQKVLKLLTAKSSGTELTVPYLITRDAPDNVLEIFIKIIENLFKIISTLKSETEKNKYTLIVKELLLTTKINDNLKDRLGINGAFTKITRDTGNNISLANRVIKIVDILSPLIETVTKPIATVLDAVAEAPENDDDGELPLEQPEVKPEPVVPVPQVSVGIPERITIHLGKTFAFNYERDSATGQIIPRMLPLDRAEISHVYNSVSELKTYRVLDRIAKGEYGDEACEKLLEFFTDILGLPIRNDADQRVFSNIASLAYPTDKTSLAYLISEYQPPSNIALYVNLISASLTLPASATHVLPAFFTMRKNIVNRNLNAEETAIINKALVDFIFKAIQITFTNSYRDSILEPALKIILLNMTNTENTNTEDILLKSKERLDRYFSVNIIENPVEALLCVFLSLIKNIDKASQQTLVNIFLYFIRSLSIKESEKNDASNPILTLIDKVDADIINDEKTLERIIKIISLSLTFSNERDKKRRLEKIASLYFGETKINNFLEVLLENGSIDTINQFLKIIVSNIISDISKETYNVIRTLTKLLPVVVKRNNNEITSLYLDFLIGATETFHNNYPQEKEMINFLYNEMAVEPREPSGETLAYTLSRNRDPSIIRDLFNFTSRFAEKSAHTTGVYPVQMVRVLFEPDSGRDTSTPFNRIRNLQNYDYISHVSRGFIQTLLTMWIPEKDNVERMTNMVNETLDIFLSEDKDGLPFANAISNKIDSETLRYLLKTIERCIKSLENNQDEKSTLIDKSLRFIFNIHNNLIITSDIIEYFSFIIEKSSESTRDGVIFKIFDLISPEKILDITWNHPNEPSDGFYDFLYIILNNSSADNKDECNQKIFDLLRKNEFCFSIIQEWTFHGVNRLLDLLELMLDITHQSFSTADNMFDFLCSWQKQGKTVEEAIKKFYKKAGVRQPITVERLDSLIARVTVIVKNKPKPVQKTAETIVTAPEAKVSEVPTPEVKAPEPKEPEVTVLTSAEELLNIVPRKEVIFWERELSRANTDAPTRLMIFLRTHLEKYNPASIEDNISIRVNYILQVITSGSKAPAMPAIVEYANKSIYRDPEVIKMFLEILIMSINMAPEYEQPWIAERISELLNVKLNPSYPEKDTFGHLILIQNNTELTQTFLSLLNELLKVAQTQNGSWNEQFLAQFLSFFEEKFTDNYDTYPNLPILYMICKTSDLSTSAYIFNLLLMAVDACPTYGARADYIVRIHNLIFDKVTRRHGPFGKESLENMYLLGAPSSLVSFKKDLLLRLEAAPRSSTGYNLYGIPKGVKPIQPHISDVQLGPSKAQEPWAPINLNSAPS